MVVTGGRSIAALHTKALVVDRRSTFVGSFNLDPRSANINTEVGLLVDSPELARQVASYSTQASTPDNAYHVTLDARGQRDGRPVDGEVATSTTRAGNERWKRFMPTCSGCCQSIPSSDSSPAKHVRLSP